MQPRGLCGAPLGLSWQGTGTFFVTGAPRRTVPVEPPPHVSKIERYHCLTGTVFVGHRSVSGGGSQEPSPVGHGEGYVVRRREAGVTRGRFLSHTGVRTGGTKKPSPLSHLLKGTEKERYHPFNMYGPPPTAARVV